MYGCYHERDEIVRFLVFDESADRTILNDQNRSALTIAAILGNIQILKNVFHENIIDVQDIYDYTPLFYAVKHRHYSCVKYLLKQKSNPDLLCNNKTALMFCAKKNDKLMIQLLLKYGADVNISNSKDKTAIDYAKKTNNDEIIRLLNIHGQNDIKQILKKEGLEHYWIHFEENNINFQQFLNMTELDMKNIGISKFGPRRKLSLIIAAIKEDFSSL
ncbi:hypothetical protein O3M35_007871 [Rhynocoris fuscipes]|uniref:SAM domain-containing protein n=1 Tax=Rhynocoris fuscipes TaxID=488301 RepID=A0AAW1DAU1_9HEMI